MLKMSSLPRMMCASKDDIDRRYRPDGVTYTTSVPSGDTATTWRLAKSVAPSGRLNVSRVTTGIGKGRMDHAAAAPNTAATIATAAIFIAGLDHDRAGTGRATTRRLSGSSSTIRASPISRSRCPTFRSRQRSIRRRTGGGIEAGSAAHSMSCRRTDASVSATSSPWNARRPDSIS